MKNVQISQTQIADFCRQHQIRWLALFGSVLRDDYLVQCCGMTLGQKAM
jgi:predicted nucleotidyltransferase